MYTFYFETRIIFEKQISKLVLTNKVACQHFTLISRCLVYKQTGNTTKVVTFVLGGVMFVFLIKINYKLVLATNCLSHQISHDK